MHSLIQRFGFGLGSLIIIGVAVWLLGLVLAPNLMMLDFSLRPNLTPAQIGGPDDHYTLVNFSALFENPVHRAIFFKTIWASALVTLTALVITYPMAFWLAKMATQKAVGFVTVALIIPFWINEVLRTLAWYILLAFGGPLNVALVWLGILNAPMRWFGDTGVLVGMVYAYILFMLFPVYNSISTLDSAQIEAARNLGASTFQIHRRIVIPHAKAGIATGCVFTFMLAAGSYVAPALLGAPGSRWFTEVIYNWFFEGGNWNRGAAYALVLLALCMIVVMAALRIFKVNLADVAK